MPPILLFSIFNDPNSSIAASHTFSASAFLTNNVNCIFMNSKMCVNTKFWDRSDKPDSFSSTKRSSLPSVLTIYSFSFYLIKKINDFRNRCSNRTSTFHTSVKSLDSSLPSMNTIFSAQQPHDLNWLTTACKPVGGIIDRLVSIILMYDRVDQKSQIHPKLETFDTQ